MLETHESENINNMTKEDKLLKLTEENNKLLKQILSILVKNDTARSFAINLFANLLSNNR